MRLALPLVEWRTKKMFRKLAREVAAEMREYEDIGFEITGILAVSGSPFCSVTEKVDFRKSFEFASRVDLDTLNRRDFNEGMETTWTKGQAWFMSALEREMRNRGVEAPFLELDLGLEKRGGTYDFNRLTPI